MLKTLVEHNAGYYAVISNMEQRPWGRLFINTDVPDNWDCNHAQILHANAASLPNILQQIEEFYCDRQVAARVRYNQIQRPRGIEEALIQRGYAIRPATYKIMLWDNIPIEPIMRPGITVEQVEEHNRGEALHILRAERAWGLPEELAAIFAREYAHPQVNYYLARYQETPVAVGALFYQGIRARVDNVRTAPEYRGRGCAAALINHIQREYTSRGGQGLYLLAGDAVQGLYAKQAFEVLGEIEEFNALLET